MSTIENNFDNILNLINTRTPQQDIYQLIKTLHLPQISFQSPIDSIYTLINEWKNIKQILDILCLQRTVSSNQILLNQNLLIQKQLQQSKQTNPQYCKSTQTEIITNQQSSSQTAHISDDCTPQQEFLSEEDLTELEFSPASSRQPSLTNLLQIYNPKVQTDANISTCLTSPSSKLVFQPLQFEKVTRQKKQLRISNVGEISESESSASTPQGFNCKEIPTSVQKIIQSPRRSFEEINSKFVFAKMSPQARQFEFFNNL